MLKQLILENWKSFRYAELPLDSLTILIGTNASGKSNVVEAFEFLQRIVRGENIEAALAGNKTLSSIRGGVEWAALKPETEFTLNFLVQGDDENTDYLYAIKIQTQPVVLAVKEFIQILDVRSEKSNILSEFSIRDKDSFIPNRSALNVAEGNGIVAGKGIKNIIQKKYHLKNHEAVSEKIREITYFVIKALEKPFVLNPIPSAMRGFSRLSDNLESDFERVNEKIETEIAESTTLVLPLASVIETGNHIAQAKINTINKFPTAQKFAEIITYAADETTPWAAFSEQIVLWEAAARLLILMRFTHFLFIQFWCHHR